MSTRHVKSPPPLFLFFLSSCPPFSCSTAPQAFSRPDRRIVVGRRAQMLSRLAASSAATLRPRPLQQSSTTADLMGRGRLHSCCYLSVSRVSAHYSDRSEEHTSEL